MFDEIQISVERDVHANECWWVRLKSTNERGGLGLAIDKIANLKRLRDALTDAIFAHEVGKAGAEAVERIVDQAVAAPAPHDPRD
jgi:hypothetical protein